MVTLVFIEITERSRSQINFFLFFQQRVSHFPTRKKNCFFIFFDFQLTLIIYFSVNSKIIINNIMGD